MIEGTRTRTQVFEGVVIKRQGSGVRETFTVRKQSFGVGVERTFPLHSPKIEQLEVAARGDVRRAKLYYLRDRVGKAARVAERRWGIDDDVLSTEDDAARSMPRAPARSRPRSRSTAPEGEETAEPEAEAAPSRRRRADRGAAQRPTRPRRAAADAEPPPTRGAGWSADGGRGRGDAPATPVTIRRVSPRGTPPRTRLPTGRLRPGGD